MMTIIDGLEFSHPLSSETIRALAALHRQQLGEAIYHEDQHIGNLGLLHRAKIAAFTHNLTLSEQHYFYDVYNQALYESAIDDPIHPPHAEQRVNVFLFVVVLAMIAAMLYFAFVHHITSY
ncbi:hypothetical protein [Acinetobacter sp. MD2]|uniref:hypothetical protein n=1 Tax=Acinetobacter sp. MD2 TaxID=2600066 RepID=UPI002D1F890F|nr:hypothetical protein [Acinetobacter sp. MD2]MEB3766330.1 hypothetical protein [Acinetobacter sp. MD2]